jgi:hypothetical protein
VMITTAAAVTALTAARISAAAPAAPALRVAAPVMTPAQVTVSRVRHPGPSQQGQEGSQLLSQWLQGMQQSKQPQKPHQGDIVPARQQVRRLSEHHPHVEELQRNIS